MFLGCFSVDFDVFLDCFSVDLNVFLGCFSVDLDVFWTVLQIVIEQESGELFCNNEVLSSFVIVG